MRHLSIDIETKSDIDIGKAGAYKYAQSEAFEILLFAYMEDDEEVKIVDFTEGETIPNDIVAALQNPGIIKHAYNAAFEWYCLSQVGYKTDLSQWQCTMVHGLYCGYTAGLEATGNAIGLPQDKKKLTAGRALIKYFCTPCKPTKSNGGRLWNLPQHDPDKWELFVEYCKQDVVTEREIEKRLAMFPVPEDEWNLWRLDVEMNALGVRVDNSMISGALSINTESNEALIEEAKELTGLDNPNSTAQVLPWLCKVTGMDIPNLQKATVEELLNDDIPDDARHMLKLRQQIGKTSIKKYETMKTAVCDDERIRGIMQFYGANRTGRWAGRLVQMQNLPRNYINTLDTARHLIQQANYKGLKLVYGNVPDALSQLIRTTFIPSEGNKFVVADFSAIEARVIAWLAGETWVNEVFATHGKIYEATASQMFGVPVERIKKGNPEYDLRQKGKVATLALGYQGGANALIAMGALNMGIPEDELPDIVTKWRQANPNIVQTWYAIEKAAVECISTAMPTRPFIRGSAPVSGIEFRLEHDLIYGHTFLTVLLPSGRKLYYAEPFLNENKFGKYAVHYYGVNAQKKWSVESTYGGKLTENIVQAIARDCLAVTLMRISERGYDIVFHVHDEVIIDAPQERSLDEICNIMATPIDWAPGLILKGAGFESNYYMKD